MNSSDDQQDREQARQTVPEPAADGRISDVERAALRRAVAIARQGEGLVEPNPMVGCVVLQNGVPAAEGWHTRFGSPHAEVEALRQIPDGPADCLVVTLEPCCHHGKTPPCTDLILQRGVRRVVIGCMDPNPVVSGRGAAVLRDAGVNVEVIDDFECRELIRPFAKLQRTARPWVIAKWAMSLDGRIATARGDSRWITSEETRAVVHRLRGRVDAILTGIGTVLADDPLLTARPAGIRRALRVICDSNCRLPLDSQLVRSAREYPTLVAVATGADREKLALLENAGVEVLTLEPDTHAGRMECLLAGLGRRGCTNLLVEGGSRILGTLAEMNAIDEVHCHVAPIVIGGQDAPGPVGGSGASDLAGAWRLGPLKTVSRSPDVLMEARRLPGPDGW